MTRRVRRWAGASAAALLLFLSLPFAATWWLTRPCRRVVDAAPDDLSATTVALTLPDGTRLAGFEIDVVAPRAAFLVLHGRGSSRGAMVGRARLLKELGCASLLLDLQGHGESGGDIVTLGAREAEAAAAGLARLRERWPSAKRGAIGISMGGAALCLALKTRGIDLVVLESTFATLDSAFDGRMRRFSGPFASLLTPIASAGYRAATGIHPATVQPIDHVADLAAPLLILHGRADPSTRFADAEALFAAAREPKQLVAFGDAGHEDLLKHSPDLYARTLQSFLTAHLPQ